MPNELLIIGDCSIDLYMNIDDDQNVEKTKNDEICFIHGSKVQVKEFKVNLAGNACHVGVSAALLGIKTQIYSEFGDDDYADRFIKTFNEVKIDTTYCFKNKGTNTNVHAILHANKERTIFSYHEPRTYKNIFGDTYKLEKPKWLYYTSLAHGYEQFQNDLIEYIEENKDIGVAFNPGTLQIKGPKETLARMLNCTNILIVNKQEAQQILDTDEQDIEILHKKLHDFKINLSLITDGGNGSSVFDGNKLYKKDAPIIKGNIKDKTGSGDAYAAAFIAALHYGKNISTAMDWGNRNAASTITKIGALSGLLNRIQIEKE